MTPKPTAAIEKIGSRLLQTTRQLFKLPVPDKSLKIFRELTALPAIRLSETLQPYCGDELVQPRNNADESIHEADSARVAARPIQRSSSRAGVEGGDVNEPDTRQRARVFESSNAPSSVGAVYDRAYEVAKIFPVMKVLNLEAVRKPEAVDEWESRRALEQPAAKTRPQAQRGDESQSRERVKGQTHQYASGMHDEPRWAAEQLPVSSSDASPAPVTAFRLAQGTPRIAALLQAHFTDKAKNESKVELVQLPEDKLVARAVTDRAYSREDKGSMVDMDLLTEKLAEQLELDLMRMYGTSER